jgi:glycosyltransferase involved in cell wall biosynthesis
MKNATKTASMYRKTKFLMLSYTNFGVWEEYGEAAQIKPWLSACENTDNCFFGANNRRVYECLKHLKNIRYVPNTHSSVFFPPRPIPDDKCINVGYAGRLDWVKNLHGISLAISQISKASEIKLHLWGQSKDGLYNNHYGRWLNFVSENVIIHNYADGHEALRNELVRNKISVFVHPSYSESYCYSVADALSAGIPVVGSNSIEFIPEEWKVEDPGNCTLIAKKIVELSKINENSIFNAQRLMIEDNKKRIRAVKSVLKKLL